MFELVAAFVGKKALNAERGNEGHDFADGKLLFQGRVILYH